MNPLGAIGNAVVSGADEITPAWLETALRRHGALVSGGVAALDVRPQPARRWSCTTRLQVRYAPGSRGECPERLLLKSCRGTFSDAEPRWYAEHAALAGVALPACYDIAWAAEPPRYHLLLRDLSDTHGNCDERPVTAGHAAALADALAALHALHWQHAGPPPDPAAIERWFAHVSAGLAPMAEARPALDRAWFDRLPRLFAAAPARYAERASSGRNLTHVHGDLNPGNLLAPREADGPLLFIDHQPFDWSFTRWLGAADLMTASVAWWSPVERRALQPALLERYHAALSGEPSRRRASVRAPFAAAGRAPVGHGVRGYAFEQLLDDCRLTIVEAFGMGVEWCREAADRVDLRWLWERELQRAAAAWDDLACDRFWRLGP